MRSHAQGAEIQEEMLSSALKNYRFEEATAEHISLVRQSDRPIGQGTSRIFAGAVIQPIPGKRLTWVANALGAGAGKIITRWAGHWPAFDQGVRDWYLQQQEHGIVHAAFDDGTSFSADSSLEVFPAVLGIAAQQRVHASRRLRLDDLHCVVDGNDELALLDARSGSKVVFHYTSLLSLGVRGWFTQLLGSFETCGLGGILSDVRRRAVKEAGVNPETGWPRLTLDRQVVLTRRQWILKKGTVPSPPPSTPFRGIIKHYVEWHLDAGLPPEAYLRKTTLTKYGLPEKPQYCNWNSTVWILFFHKYLSKIDGDILVEEALPQASCSLGGRMTELAINWYA